MPSNGKEDVKGGITKEPGIGLIAGKIKDLIYPLRSFIGKKRSLSRKGRESCTQNG